MKFCQRWHKGCAVVRMSGSFEVSVPFVTRHPLYLARVDVWPRAANSDAAIGIDWLARPTTVRSRDCCTQPASVHNGGDDVGRGPSWEELLWQKVFPGAEMMSEDVIQTLWWSRYEPHLIFLCCSLHFLLCKDFNTWIIFTRTKSSKWDHWCDHWRMVFLIA